MGVKHKHHIIPKHAGGTNDPDNLTPPISVRLHAMFHYDRWRELGDSADWIAYRFLIGRLSTEQARVMAVSALLKGRKFSPDTLAKMSVAQRRRAAEGRMPKKSAENRAAHSEYRKAHPECHAAMVASVAGANARREWSPESRARLGASHRARWASLSDVDRQKLTAGLRAPASEDTKRKLSSSLRGRKFSHSHCAAISAAAKRRWEDPRLRNDAAERGRQQAEKRIRDGRGQFR